MLIKTTNKLFLGTYQYKTVLVCPGASLFRSMDLDATLEGLMKIDLDRVDTHRYSKSIKTKEDLDYAFKLQKALSKSENIEVRVESPWISVYSKDKATVDLLCKLDPDRVKYISVPPSGLTLEHNTVIMPKTPFDYRITLGKTTQCHDTFIEWAEQNTKVKLTKSSKKDLSKKLSWGGTHFYVKGDNNLLMVKMHLGGSISKVERIVKA